MPRCALFWVWFLVSCARPHAEPSTSAPSEASARTSTAPSQPFAVLELFTSEGCSSCPPADRALAALADEAERSGARVFPLSFHVDYWNDLGWSDPFSDHAYSTRQSDYAQAFGLRGVYTPELVVNGREEFLGSDSARARDSITLALARTPAAWLALRAHHDGRQVRVEFSAPRDEPAEVALALVEASAESRITLGENRGVVAHHRNLVRAFSRRALAENGRGEWSVLAPENVPLESAFVVGLLTRRGDPTLLAAERAALGE